MWHLFAFKDLCLYDHMSIIETFHFYGRLYGMDWNDVTVRASELINFLELPVRSRIVASLR